MSLLKAVLESLAMVAGAWLTLVLFIVLVLPLAGCATDGQGVQVVEHTTSITVAVPDEVRCFRKADIPVAPPVIAANVKTATPHQLAEASAGNAEAWIKYGKAMQAQFKQCEDAAPEAAQEKKP